MTTDTLLAGVARLSPPPPAPASAPIDALWTSLSGHANDPAQHLGEALVRRGLVTPAQLAKALARQANDHPRRALGAILVDEGMLRGDQLEGAISDWLGMHVVDLSSLTPQSQALSLVPAGFAERESVLPLMLRDGHLVVALADPWNSRNLLNELRLLTRLDIVPVAAAPATLAAAISRAYREAATAGSAHPRDTRELAAELARQPAPALAADVAAANGSDSTLVLFINSLIADAIRLRASDIHVETGAAPTGVGIRLRIDGDLVNHLELPARYAYAMISRLKIMADLDIAEHRKPQDGKIDFARFGGPHMEMRMVVVPTAHGMEDVVLRLLGGLKPMPLENIDLSPVNLAALREVIVKPYGLILICGPTGSGKTTTMHSAVREINTEKRKIWTAEDPVEITQPGLRQVQINPRIGWTFAAAMRTFLRADPDVIVIGEMRDEETARIAVEASLTGHLVMSTLHTNSAAESIARLLEIGLDPFTFSDSLLGILAQRLVRRLCVHCRVHEPIADDELQHLADLYLASGGGAGESREHLLERWRSVHGDAQGRVLRYRHAGCAHCESSGFHGRLGLHEFLDSDDALRELVRRRAPARDVVALSQARGMPTLLQDGIEKMLAGLTELPEVLAATNH
ncbi:MAG: Flp pilus assembly complex ATPase component TadA [Betaproteobacteria bacterium]|nr:Flp pilus assembly complex ATPase component TadA [Betaproteobacteria bacterium]MBU6511053.1 Flp pilus assembly complex ATPase component TadA [Betaproteobacteria bacterium]MDE2151380.1 Flp pilus assembly complex ATPase component TadA [Betaproteobacteria bacterium]MDE2479171.1 Flp pilus assembly complex ATPase component TadA [Betaproteobacteria bacterium]